MPKPLPKQAITYLLQASELAAPVVEECRICGRYKSGSPYHESHGRRFPNPCCDKPENIRMRTETAGIHQADVYDILTNREWAYREARALNRKAHSLTRYTVHEREGRVWVEDGQMDAFALPSSIYKRK